MNDITTSGVVPRDHPSLAGHFPGRPIVPGVVLLDLIFDAIQSAAAQRVQLESIVSTKFLQAVAPEVPIEMQIRFTPETEANRVKARFVATHAAATVLEGSFLLAIEQPGGAP